MRGAGGPTAKCGRCERRKATHFDNKCDDGKEYQPVLPRFAASMSFGPEEVEVLRCLVKNATLGTSSTYLVRAYGYRDLARKIQTMMRRLEHLKKAKEAKND